MFTILPGTRLHHIKVASPLRNAVFLSLLVVIILVVGCASDKGDFDRRLHSIVEPHGFNLLGWELEALADELKSVFVPGEKTGGDEAQLVREYFSLIEQIQALKSDIGFERSSDGEDSASLQGQLESLRERRDALEDTVEGIVEKQIRDVLIEERILNPLDNYFHLGFVFPPVNFEFVQPPHLLVISPRDRIDLSQRVLLSQDLTPEEKERIESETDELGVSSLVVEISGFAATYPATIVDSADLRSTIDRAVEEWLHQYLAFRPMGFLYLLDATGIRESQDIATRNETLAGIVSRELGSRVYQRYYSELYKRDSGDKPEMETGSSEFDFDQEMRETRRTVDEYLTQGMIEEAEEFMERQRERFAVSGYHIRKLNQAYFAFHGIYADDPASVSPIYEELRVLRSQSPSLKEFLDDVAWMTTSPAQVMAVMGSLALIAIGVALWLRNWLGKR